jgi:hypothetical protein
LARRQRDKQFFPQKFLHFETLFMDRSVGERKTNLAAQRQRAVKLPLANSGNSSVCFALFKKFPEHGFHFWTE